MEYAFRHLTAANCSAAAIEGTGTLSNPIIDDRCQHVEPTKLKQSTHIDISRASIAV